MADLDALVAEPVRFRYGGKIHELKPMSLEQFLRFSNAQSALMSSVNEDGPMTARALAEKYHRVISSVCDTISLEDIMGMEQVQVAALYQLVIDLVTGQVQTGDSKKKRRKLEIYESVPLSSSQSAPANSDGRSENH